MKYFLSLIAVTAFLSLSPIHAQQETEKNTTYHTFQINTGGNYSQSSAKKVSMMFNNKLGYSVSKDKLVLNANASWVYETQNKTLSKNDFNFTLDFNYYFNEFKRFYGWGLNNYETAYSLKINHKYQAGVGLAYELIDDDVWFLRLSNGLLWETSNIIDAGEQLLYETWRNSFRLQFRAHYYEKIQFKYTGFWQPSIIDFDDQLLKMNAQLLIKIWKELDFKLEGQYNMVTRTKQENMLFTYGFSYKILF